MCNGILYEMLYASFIYNLGYSASSVSSLSYEGILLKLLYYSECLLLLLSVIPLLFSKKWCVVSILWTCISLCTFSYLLMTYGYDHYGIIAIPYVFAFVACMNLWNAKIEFVKLKQIILTAYILSSICVFMYKTCSVLKNIESDDEVIDKETMKYVVDSDVSSFIAYNFNPYVYLKYDIMPANRFFWLQDWANSNNKSLSPLIICEFEKLEANWILFNNSPKNTLIWHIVKKNYVLVERQEDKNYYLYRLKR